MAKQRLVNASALFPTAAAAAGTSTAATTTYTPGGVAGVANVQDALDTLAAASGGSGPPGPADQLTAVATATVSTTTASATALVSDLGATAAAPAQSLFEMEGWLILGPVDGTGNLPQLDFEFLDGADSVVSGGQVAMGEVSERTHLPGTMAAGDIFSVSGISIKFSFIIETGANITGTIEARAGNRIGNGNGNVFCRKYTVAYHHNAIPAIQKIRITPQGGAQIYRSSIKAYQIY